MKHRDRVLMALNHEEPDRCPMQVSFTPEFASRLEHDLGLTDEDFYNPHGGGNTYVLERALDEDMLLTSVGWANSYYATETYSEDGETYTDEWGITWKNVAYETEFGKGHYTEMVGHPLADDRAIDAYQPPDPNRPELYAEAERAIEEYKDEYWIVGVTVTTIFETAWALRGYEKTLMDLALNPDFIERLFDIPFHYHLTAAKRLVEMGVDMIWTGDDVGAQNKMLISPATWRRFFKPRMAAFISTLKSINPELKVAYHSDGLIFPIIPDLIEIGLDVLNPIQPRSMEPEEVKKKFGDKLCFWGSIDEQHTLPFGTPADVEGEVIARLRTLGKNGGLIIGPTHHVQLDTPLENFWAMVNTITQTSYSSI
jgi:uroporphyrinogen decarboxylase